MSEDVKTTVHGELLAFGRKVFGSQALATLLLMGLAAFGYRALAADSRDAGVEAVKPVVERQDRLEARQLEQDKDVAELKRRIERTEVVSVDTNANVKIIMVRMGLQPVSPVAPEPKDGGR